MGSDLVVFHQTVISNFPDLRKSLEHLHIEDLITVSPVEPFHKRVLSRFAWLDELKLNTVLFGPLRQDQRGEFRAVVDPQLLRIAPRIGSLAPAIAERCGYLPLALRLAASALATHATAFASNLPSTSVLFRISHGPLPFDNVPTY